MDKTAVAMLLEVVETSGLAVGAGIFSYLGFHLESLGVAALTTGQRGMGFWLVGMGLLALYVGVYLLGYETLRPRLTGDESEADAA